MKLILRPISRNESALHLWSESHRRSNRAVLLALAFVFESLILTANTQASDGHVYIAGRQPTTTILVEAGVLLFMLLPALFGIRRKPVSDGERLQEIPPGERDARVERLEDQ